MENYITKIQYKIREAQYLIEELQELLSQQPYERPKKAFNPIQNIHWADKDNLEGEWRGLPIHNGELEVTYKKSERGTERITQFVEFEKTMEATLEFEAKFGKNFSFDSEGIGNKYYEDGYPFIVGKFHGLGPHDPTTAREEKNDDGWSVRIYWRKSTRTHNLSPDDPNFQHDSNKFDYKDGVTFGVNYYGQDRPARSPGTFVPSNWTGVENNVWYKFSLYVKINEVDEPNDIIKLKISQDGEEIGSLELDNIMLIKRKGEIERFLFSTFFGGSSTAFSPKQNNMKAYFKNFKITI